MKRLKNIAIHIHRITGSILSLLFLLWFISGIVMIFDGFPHASRKERFEHLETFSAKQLQNLLPPAANWKGKVNLELSDGKPVYRVISGRKAQVTYDAKTLNPLEHFSEEHATKLASSFLGNEVKKVKLLNELDQWIPWSYYQPLLPFYKCYMNDPAHTVLYISQKTGEIVQQTDRKARWAARCGAIPHWMYFKQIRLQKGLWVELVLCLSGMGIAMSFTGIIVGFIRYKKGKGLSPYKKPMYKWHHITGYVFGLFVFTFVLSGFFSLAHVPDWMVFISTKNEKKINWGQDLDLTKQVAVSPIEIYEALEQKEGVRKISWLNIHGTPAFAVYYNSYQIPETYELTDNSIQKKGKYSISEMEKIAKNYLEETNFSIIEQEKYDNYYYGSAMYYLPQPVYKLVAENASETWIYINPITAESVKTYTKNTRLRRWLYQGLHKFNFKFLREEAEWFRKLLLILISIGGIAVSATGVWMSKNWVRRTVRKTRKFSR